MSAVDDTQLKDASEKAPDKTTDAIAANAPAPKSWGEKYGRWSFEFTRDWGINYFINFVIGAVFAYRFDTSKYGARMQHWLDRASGMDKILEAEKRGETIVQKGIWSPSTKRYVLNIITRNQFLLLGGHILLPVMKVMRQHENQIVFWSQHKLDELQEFTGNGNEASKRNLKDYETIQDLRGIAKHGGDLKLTDAEKQVMARHYLDDKVQYQEKHESWGRVLKARIIGMTCSTAAAAGLGWLSGQKYVPALQYKRVLEAPFGRWAAKNVIGKVPFLRTFFAKDPKLIGEYFIADALLTIVSAGVYRMVEKHEENKEGKQENAKEQAPLSTPETKVARSDEKKAEPVVQQVKLDGPISANALAHAVK